MRRVFTSTGGAVMRSTRPLAPFGASTPPTPPGVGPPTGAAGIVQRVIARRVRAAMGAAPITLVLPSGEELVPVDRSAVGRITIRDLRTLVGLCGPSRDLVFGDGYTRGDIDVEGALPDVLETIFAMQRTSGFVQRLGERWRWLRRRRNSLRAARENVHRHYDLGNDFYARWLDREMVYTCAYFWRPAVSLEAAQIAKMEHVARKLRLRHGETVVEAGCGWGSLALYLARSRGVRVRAFNISREQIDYARERAKAEGFVGRVEFIEDDYRNLTGRYDAFVSIGMLEHVGPEHYLDLGRVIGRALAPEGRGLLHFIGRSQPHEFSRWVERRIFPGAYPPTLREASALLEPHDLAILDVENLRPHYARTLEHWLSRFEGHRDEIARRFDERFVRMWRLYLAGSIAAFRTGSLQLFQVLFARSAASDVAWTREDLYGEMPAEATGGAL